MARKRLEDSVVYQFAEYLRNNNYVFQRYESNIPTKNFAVIKRMQKEGWQSGDPDIFILLPRMDRTCQNWYGGLYIELKHENGAFPVSTGRDKQYNRLLEFASCGYASFCCKGVNAAIAVLKNYEQGILDHLYVQGTNNNKKLKQIARNYNKILKELKNEK